MNEERPVLIATGDSHCKFWTGIDSQKGNLVGRLPFVDVVHLGPATAYNIAEDGTTTGGKETLIKHLEERTRRFDGFIVCLGEIDCRAHILKAAVKNGMSLEIATEKTVRRYFRFLDWLSESYGRPILVWGPGPTAPSSVDKQNAKVPRVGTPIERNYITMLFNAYAEQMASAREGFAFGTLFPNLLRADGTSMPEAFYDNVHVSKRVLNQAVAIARQSLTERGLEELLPALEPWNMSTRAGFLNIAAGIKPVLDRSGAMTKLPALSSRLKGTEPFPLIAGDRVTVDLKDYFLGKSLEFHFATADNAEIEFTFSADNVDTGASDALHVSSATSEDPSPWFIKLPEIEPLRFLRIEVRSGSLEFITLRFMVRSFIRTE